MNLGYASRLEAFNSAIDSAREHASAINELANKYRDPTVTPQALAEATTSSIAGGIGGVAGAITGIQHFQKFKEIGNNLIDGLKQQGQQSIDAVTNTADNIGSQVSSITTQPQTELPQTATNEIGTQASVERPMMVDATTNIGAEDPIPQNLLRTEDAYRTTVGLPAVDRPNPADAENPFSPSNIGTVRQRIQARGGQVSRTAGTNTQSVGGQGDEFDASNQAHIDANTTPNEPDVINPNNTVSGAIEDVTGTNPASAVGEVSNVVGDLAPVEEGLNIGGGVLDALSGGALAPAVGVLSGLVALGSDIAKSFTKQTVTPPAPPPVKMMTSTASSIGANMSNDHQGSMGIGVY